MKCNPKINGTTRWRPGKCSIPVDCQLCCVVREEHIESFGTVLPFRFAEEKCHEYVVSNPHINKKQHFTHIRNVCAHSRNSILVTDESC